MSTHSLDTGSGSVLCVNSVSVELDSAGNDNVALGRRSREQWLFLHQQSADDGDGASGYADNVHAADGQGDSCDSFLSQVLGQRLEKAALCPSNDPGDVLRSEALARQDSRQSGSCDTLKDLTADDQAAHLEPKLRQIDHGNGTLNIQTRASPQHRLDACNSVASIEDQASASTKENAVPVQIAN